MSSAQGLISAENIAKNYGKGDVLRDVSLGVLRGERIGIVGRNGGVQILLSMLTLHL